MAGIFIFLSWKSDCYFSPCRHHHMALPSVYVCIMCVFKDNFFIGGRELAVCILSLLKHGVHHVNLLCRHNKEFR